MQSQICQVDNEEEAAKDLLEPDEPLNGNSFDLPRTNDPSRRV